eukprot:PhM_4_TR17047/c0_g1_i1/m.8495
MQYTLPALSEEQVPPRIWALLGHELSKPDTPRELCARHLRACLACLPDILPLPKNATLEDIEYFIPVLIKQIQMEATNDEDPQSSSPSSDHPAFVLLCRLYDPFEPHEMSSLFLSALRRVAVRAQDSEEQCKSLRLECCLSRDDMRASMVAMLQSWDRGYIPCHVFLDNPLTLHLYVPRPETRKPKVYRDFAFCTVRPKLAFKPHPRADLFSQSEVNPTKATEEETSKEDPVGEALLTTEEVDQSKGVEPPPEQQEEPENPPPPCEPPRPAAIHIKTNVARDHPIMYRLLIEGYNYGTNAVVAVDASGYTHHDQCGPWPDGWGKAWTTEYAPGAAVSQYYSTDGFLVVKLTAKSFFCCGFSVSAWLTTHGYGEGFPITIDIVHDDENNL